MSSQTNFGAALDPAVSVHAQLAVKDEYTFAFLDLEDAHGERELEPALTRRVEAFCRFSLIRTIFLKKYNFARSRACLVGAKTMGFSRRRRLMQGEIRDY